MNKAISLFILVHSLSKSEKRYFRLASRLQAGEKLYLALFDLFEREESVERAQEAFAQSHPGRNYTVAVGHLYELLLETLLHLREGQDVQTRLFNMISKADILFERGMPTEALAELTRARKLAEIYRKEALLLIIRRAELRYLAARDFEGVDEKRLVSKQMKITEVMKSLRSSNLHTQLYDILVHRFIRRGYARSKQQKKALDDLLLQELNLVANTSYKSFETEKLHLLFQATYFLQSGHDDSALRYYRRLIELFDENLHLLQNPPIHYRNALTGILDTLERAGLDPQMDYFLEKLRQLEKEKYPAEFLLGLRAQRYLYESSALLRQEKYQEALRLREQFEADRPGRGLLPGLEMQLRLHLHACVLAVWTEDWEKAREQMRKILSAGKLLYAFPLYRVARLINLILQAERGEYDFVESETKALRREIRLDKRQSLYATEKLVFQFVRTYPLPTQQTQREKLHQKYKTQTTPLYTDKYERPLLQLFDIPKWILRRLQDGVA